MTQAHFIQKQLWFLEQFAGQGSAYITPRLFEISGEIDLAKLHGALSTVFQQNLVLRSTLVTEDGALLRRDSAENQLSFEVKDYTYLAPDAARTQAKADSAQTVSSGFDLTKDAPICIRVMKVAANQTHLLILTHATAVDDVAMPLLLAQISAAYNSSEPSANGEVKTESAVTSLPHDEKYWRAEVAKPVQTVALPTDFPRGPVQTFDGGLATRTISVDSQNFPAERRHAAALAAYQVVLSRYTGSTQFFVGSQFDIRPKTTPETLQPFGNTVLLHADLADSPGFATLVNRAQEAIDCAAKHVALPFAQVAELHGKAHQKQAIFQVMFGFDSAENRQLQLSGVQVEEIWLDHVPATTDLLLRVVDASDQLTLVAEYNRDLFAPTTINRLLGHVGTVLLAGLLEADRPTSHLPLLTEAEQAQMLVEWNQTNEAFSHPKKVGVHRLVEAQVAKFADKVAVLDNNKQISFDQLNQQANYLAQLLVENEVQVGDVVAVSLPRSADCEVALLAVLKMGGVYLPIDYDYPQQRIDYILEDSQATALITDSSLDNEWPAQGVNIIDLGGLTLDGQDAIHPNPEIELADDALAYLIYTSGSTGRPKGVMVSHKNITERIFSMASCHKLTSDDRQLQFVSHSFDMGIEEMLETLCFGSSVAIHDGNLQNGREFASTLADWEITKVNLPASYWSQLVDELAASGGKMPACVRLLTAGGEAMAVERLRLWPQVTSGEMTLLNGYGPTEATIIATAYDIPTDDADLLADLRVVPIGTPLPNTTVFVLDGAAQPLPIGVPGELCIGGPCVTVGYLNRPNLTAEKFIPDTFSDADNARLYRTGDLVRWNEDGQLEFLGRIDNQVKVRGYRIETGEIEQVLLTHDTLSQVVVIARPDSNGNNRLIAYSVLEDGAAAPSTSTLRQFAAETLPDYMIPSNFVTLEALPLTPNGKIDRKGLPDPSDERPELTTEFSAPQSAIEDWLAEMWRDILELKQVGVNDDFFELGGDSIRGAILINRLQEELGEYVYVVALFDAPTITQLGQFLNKHYPDALRQKFGAEVAGGAVTPTETKRLTNSDFAQFRGLIPPRTPVPDEIKPTNPKAVFIFSPPRSGSTLMRVVLAGNPTLFAPPEQYLLSFDYLGERESEFSQRYRFWREGVVRAIMNLQNVEADAAEAMMDGYEADNMSVQALYGLMQSWLPPGQIFVDKTPAYALNVDTLRRAESIFSEVYYVHLLRHPHGMIRSFEDAKTGQLFFRPKHDFTQRQLAELIWTVSHQNIVDFLKDVPASRQHKVRFEDLVRNPEPTAKALTEFLGIDLHPAMLSPQDDISGKMTDGIHPLSKMMGDVKFHQHKGFDPAIADRWKAKLDQDFLSDTTWTLAETFGYERLQTATATKPQAITIPIKSKPGGSLVPIKKSGNRLPLFCVHPVNGTVMDFVRLSKALDPEQPLYGLQAQGLDGKLPPLHSVEAMAAHYLAEIKKVQPEGPYVLGGRCMGGMVVFEMAQMLIAAGEEVAPLLLFDARAPFVFTQRRKEKIRQQRKQSAKTAKQRVGTLVREARYKGRALNQRAQDLYKKWNINRKMQTASEQERNYHSVSVANLNARENYIPKPYQGSGLIFVPTLTPDGQPRSQRSREGWREVFTDGLEFFEVEADHTNLLAEPALEKVAARLEVLLKQVR